MWRRIALACVLGAFIGAFLAVPVMAIAPPLYAQFGYVVDQGQVRFSDESTGLNIVEWEWDFGDGTTSTAQNPVHTYAEIGEYTVKLKVTDVDDVYTTTTAVVGITMIAPAEADLTIVAIAMIVMGIVVAGITRSNYGRIAAAMVALLGVILWVLFGA